MENCPSNINNFCYICGHFTPLDRKHGVFSAELTKAYEKYFDQPVFSGVPWVPDTICKTCYNGLLDWIHHKRKSMSFGVPMIWVDPVIHDPTNCYACANTVPGMNAKKQKNFEYKSVFSAITPMPHCEPHIPKKYPSPDVLSFCTLRTTETATTDESEDFSLYNPESSALNSPVLITQEKLNSIVAKLGLSQRKSEELARFLNDHHVLAAGTKVTSYRKRQSELQKSFLVNDDKTFAYCSDVNALMCAMKIEYKADEWRLFIDSSTQSLKAVLLHKTNSKPSIPIGYSTETKETYEILKKILDSVNYNDHQWKICCDLKVVAMLCGLQSGYIKHMCFLCDWNSREKGNHYEMNEWKMREESIHRDANVIRAPLVPKEKILLPPLHVKLGIVKNFVKQIAKRGEVIAVLRMIFPRLSEAKLSNGTEHFCFSNISIFRNFTIQKNHSTDSHFIRCAQRPGYKKINEIRPI